MPIRKSFVAKIYAPDGTTLRKVLTNGRPSDGSMYLKSPPSFRDRINSGQGELVLDLAAPFDDFGEGTVVDLMNIVRLYTVVTDDVAKTQSSTLVYTGLTSRYEPYLEGGQEGVRASCLGLGSLATLLYYKDGSSFTVTHSSQDPETIGRAIIDYVNSVYTASLLSYSGDTTDPVGTNVSVSWTDLTCFDALKKNGELAGGNHYWRIDEQGRYVLKQKPSSATHTLVIGKDVVSVQVVKTGEQIVNQVQVRRSGGTATNYADATSQSDYGRRDKIVSDSSITDADTADQRGNQLLVDFKDPKVSARIVLNSRAAIESIKVGETVRIRNFDRDSTVFNDNMQIVSTHYRGDELELELEQHNSDFGLALEAFVG